jgi:hypothetical protein
MDSQDMYSDVMYTREQAVLVSVLFPLDLTIASAISSESYKTILDAITEQIETLHSYRIDINLLRVDRHPSLLALRGKISGLRLELCGAGDKISRVENRIKTIKEHYHLLCGENNQCEPVIEV